MKDPVEAIECEFLKDHDEIEALTLACGEIYLLRLLVAQAAVLLPHAATLEEQRTQLVEKIQCLVRQGRIGVATTLGVLADNAEEEAA